MDPLKLSAGEVESLPEAQALEVLAAHVKAKQKALPEALAASKSKALSRAAKKALYQLRSSGVAIEEPVAAPAPQPGVASTVAELPGLLSPVLGTGEQMLIFGRPVRSGGVEFYQCVLHDEFGIQQLERAETNRSKYRRQLRMILNDQKVFEVPFARVLEELALAWGQNLRAKNGLPTDAYENLHRLRVVPNETPLEVPRPEADDAGVAAKSAGLHDEPEIQSWLPADDRMATLAEQVEALRAQKAEAPALELKAQEAADAYFEAPVRELYARRLWRMGDFFAGTGREEAAKLARAQARVMFHQDKTAGGFGLRLFEKVIALTEQAARPALGAPRAK